MSAFNWILPELKELKEQYTCDPEFIMNRYHKCDSIIGPEESIKFLDEMSTVPVDTDENVDNHHV